MFLEIQHAKVTGGATKCMVNCKIATVSQEDEEDRHRCQIQCLHLRGFPLVLSSFRYRTPIIRGSMDPSTATFNCYQAKYIPSPFRAVGCTRAKPFYKLALPTLSQAPLVFHTKIPPKRLWAAATGQWLLYQPRLFKTPRLMSLRRQLIARWFGFLPLNGMIEQNLPHDRRQCGEHRSWLWSLTIFDRHAWHLIPRTAP